MPLYPSFPQQSHPQTLEGTGEGTSFRSQPAAVYPKVKSHRPTSGCQRVALGCKPTSLNKQSYFIKKQHNYFGTPTSGTVKFRTAACRDGTQAAVSGDGRAGLHRGWSRAPRMGPTGRDPNVQGSSGPGGQVQRGQQGELNGLQRTRSPSTTISGDLLIIGAAPSWPASAPEGSTCRSGGRRGGEMGARGGEEWGAAFLLRGGAGGPHGETMAPPTPRTLSAAQMRSLPGCARRLGPQERVGRRPRPCTWWGPAHFVGFVANSGNRIQTGRWRRATPRGPDRNDTWKARA